MKLGILDLCKRGAGESVQSAIQKTIRLACLADLLGYERYWLSEHHTDDSANPVRKS